MTTKLFSILLILLISITGFAQESRKINLEEAIELGMQKSSLMKIAASKVYEAHANVHEAENNRLPDLKASGSYLRLNNPNVDLKIRLGSGGQSKPVSINEMSYVMVNASVPVFSGFRIKYGIETAKYMEQAAQFDVENQKEDVALTIINAYCSVFKSKKSVELVEENLKQQKQRVTDFANLEKNGIIPRNDLLKAQLQQSNAELTLLDAENNFRIACLSLSLLLGLPENTIFTIDSSSFESIIKTGSIADWEQGALNNRKDLAAIKLKEKAIDISIKATKGEYLPGLAVTGGYIAANIPGLLTLNNAINGGLGLQYNFGSLWKTGAKIDAAKEKLVQAQANEIIVADQIRFSINQAYENYVLSTRKIEVYEKAIEQAKENYRITKNKYENSLVTVTDLLDADIALLQARLNYIFSKTDAVLAFKKLQYAAGQLTTHNR